MAGVRPTRSGEIRMTDELRTDRPTADQLGLPRLAGACKTGNCPTIYGMDGGDVLVQGDLADLFDVPAGEGTVRIPAALLAQAYESMRGAS